MRRGAECELVGWDKGWRVRSLRQVVVVGFAAQHTHTPESESESGERERARGSRRELLPAGVCDDDAVCGDVHRHLGSHAHTIHPSPRGHNDSDVRLTILGTPHGHTGKAAARALARSLARSILPSIRDSSTRIGLCCLAWIGVSFVCEPPPSTNQQAAHTRSTVSGSPWAFCIDRIF